MRVFKTISEYRSFRKQVSLKSLGFVPTMGALHAGHDSLTMRSKRENDLTVVSLFVNPLQFNDPKDYLKYPRTEETDLRRLSELNVDAVFLPSPQEIYKSGESTRVQESQESRILEGVFRPGHFEGMLTVVNKLLNCLQPQRIYMGEKDFQQLLLVKKMVDELFIPVDVVACPTVRNKNGLALSSRNQRLNELQLKQLEMFPKILKSEKFLEVPRVLSEAGFQVEYVDEKWSRRLAAIHFCGVRFIDNFDLNDIKEKIGEVPHDTHA